VTRYLLDTNIISNVVKPGPSESLLAWFRAQTDTDLFVAALTVGEIWRGVLEQPKGKKRSALEAGSQVLKDRGPCSPGASSRSMTARRSSGRG
jgi:predicted nucleic acid-binding protein